MRLDNAVCAVQLDRSQTLKCRRNKTAALLLVDLREPEVHAHVAV
jgi:hypothetical protein